MDIAAINTIVTHMQTRSFYDVMKAMFDNHFIELPPGRWFIEVDGNNLGRSVFSHRLVLDDVLGEASETWGWTEGGKARVLHLSAQRSGALLVAVDGADQHQAQLKVDSHDSDEENSFLVLHVIVNESGEKHEYTFSGLME
jgi:hypothetical protein